MLEVVQNSQYRRDLKRCAKRGCDFDLLTAAVNTLRVPAPLPDRNRDHSLTGNWSGYKECHLAPDWLLIYKVAGNELRLARTGTHADLFGG
jgi:mRNA interferase YafQ